MQVLFLQNFVSVRDVFAALATMCDAGKEHAPVGRSVDGYKNGAAQAGKALDTTKARLKIADVDMTKPVSPDACAVTFQVQLKGTSRPG